MWRYVNPGYSGLLNYAIHTSYLTEIADASKSKTGVAYKNTSEAYNRYKLALPENGEYWVKADFFWENNNSAIIYVREPSYAGLCLNLYSDGTAVIDYYADRLYGLISRSKQALTGLKMNAINTIWLHVKWGDAGIGFLEFQINNKKFDKIQNRQFYTQPENFYFMLYSGSVYFSSVIISDEEISPYDELVRLPVSNTVTDMSARDEGGYVASDTNQTLLQAVDTATLEPEYGSDAKVTSVALVGNPAYEVDEVLTKMISLTKTGGVTTEHETVQLSHESNSVIVSSFATATDTTLADLPDIQFGWKASE